MVTLRNILWKSETRALEFGAATYAIASGIWFSLPLHTFENIIVYRYLETFVSEPQWATILIVVGVLNVYPIFSDQCRVAKWIQLATVFFWVFTANMLGHATIAAWVFLNAVFLSSVYVWLFIRTSRRCRVKMEVREELAKSK